MLFVFGTLVVSGTPLAGIFAKSGRTLSIGVDKPVPRDFKCTKLRRAYRSAVFARQLVNYGDLFIVYMDE